MAQRAQVTADDVLRAFAMDFEPGAGVLQRYLAQYPEHSMALIDLSMELTREFDDDVPPGVAEPCNALALFQHDADDSSARLIAYIDDPAVGLPFTPAAGQTVDILWDDGADHIFTIKRSTT